MSYDSQTAVSNRHDFDTTFTNEYDSNQDADIITPTSGKLIKVTGVQINVEGSVSSGYVRIYFADDENDQINTVAKVYAGSGVNHFDMNPVVIRGDRDAPLKLEATTGADGNYFVAINYKEE